ncbi:MAG: carotenoid oxygenase family protein [Acidimicrobiia bacterium]|nr:carotenoid oxygenase family protein [Acidimicrobiia bacterium]
MTTIENLYLSGNAAPVPDEITAENLMVTGTIPAELEGRWLRNGPNPIGEVDPATHHWFTGNGMVHGVRLRGGRAEWYRNRWVRGDREAEALGEPAPPGPRRSEFGSAGPNTSVGGFAGKTWAMVEAGGVPMTLTYELDTIAYDDFGGTLPNGFTAHPKFDPATRELHAVCYTWPDLVDHVQYVVVGPEGRVTKVVDVPVPDMPMIHDMSLTPSYAVVYDLPVTVDIELAMQERFPFRWNPDHPARVGLLPRTSDTADDIIWCDAPMRYVYHPVNAYETDDGQVVLDVCAYDAMFRDDLNGPFGDATPTLDRWTVDPVARLTKTERVDDRFHEFPRHDPRVATRRHRFGYTAGGPVDGSDLHGATYKTDYDTGTVTERRHGPGRGGAEPVFVPRQGSTAEDDGWLLVLVHDANADRSDLVIVDAIDFTGAEVARIELPRRVPHGFHGAWVPD